MGIPADARQVTQDLQGGRVEVNRLLACFAVVEQQHVALEIHLVPPQGENLAEARTSEDQQAYRSHDPRQRPRSFLLLVQYATESRELLGGKEPLAFVLTVFLDMTAGIRVIRPGPLCLA